MLTTIFIISIVLCGLEILFGDKIIDVLMEGWRYEDTNIVLAIPPSVTVVSALAIVLYHYKG